MMQKFDRYGGLSLLVVLMIVAMGGIITLGLSELKNTLVNRTGRDLQWTAIVLVLWGVLVWMSVRAWQEHRHAVLARQTVEQLQDVLQSSLDALTSHIAILDEEATIIAVNKAWRAFGDGNQLRDPRHGVGLNYLRICAAAGEGSEEARLVAEKLRAVLHGDQSVWEGEYPCHAPGEQRWFTVRISRFTVGGKVRVVVDHQNVTESWLTAKALRETTIMMSTVIDGALSAHVLIDRHGMVTRWNPQAEKIFGWSSQEATGRCFADLAFPSGYREAYEQGFKRFLADGAELVLGNRLEIEGWHKEGRVFSVELAMTAIQGADGAFFSVFGQDITERVQRERRQAVEHRITELLLEAASLKAASPEIMKAVCEMLGWKVGILWEVDEAWQTLRCSEVWTDFPNHYEAFVKRTTHVDFPVGIGLPGRTWASGKVEWIVDVTRDGNFPRSAAAATSGLHAGFAFPVGLGGKVSAVLEFFAEDIRPPDRKLLDLFDCVAGQISQFLARQTAEQKLMMSEARFSGILQLAHDAIVSVDESQRIVLFNKSAERIFGYAADDVLGQPLDLLIPDQLRGSHHHHVRQFSSGSTIARPMNKRSEIKGRRKNGEEFPAEASIARVAVEGQTTYTAILRDIAQRKQEEQALRDAKVMAEQLASEKHVLLATVEAFFIRLTKADVVREWTGKAEELFGISLTEAVGRSFHDLPIGWDWGVIQDAVKQASDTIGSVCLAKVQLIMQGDQPRFLKLVVSPLCTDSGIDIVIMGEDVTNQLLLEHDLVQAQKLESIGHLAAGIAHEINTPTQFVGDNLRFLSESFADLLTVLDRHRTVLASAKTGSCAPDLPALIEACEAESRRADLDYLTEEIPKALAQTSDGVARIATIVRAMKEFSHPAGDAKICVDLNRAIESTVTVARHEWKYVADLTTDLAHDLPPVPCLIDQFNQVILNLIVNASHAIADVIKGTGPKGVITITTRRDGEWVEIRVTDTGVGIPENIRHKIFDPFFTTKEVGKGTGQGLAIARSVVVDKHQGTITVESQVGIGSTFIIRLPVSVPAGGQAMERAA